MDTIVPLAILEVNLKIGERLLRGDLAQLSNATLNIGTLD
jgi:hypothetical protein